MALQSFEVFTGYIGFIPVYHTIYFEVPDEIHPIHSKKFSMKEPNIKVKDLFKTKAHLHKKRSLNYEGTGKNYSR